MNRTNRHSVSERVLDRNIVWNKPIQYYLSALVALQLIPLLSVVPPWVSVAAFALVGWKVWHLNKGTRLPPKNIVTAISALGMVGVALTKHTLIGEDAATASLAIIACCKLLECNRYRDTMVTLVLCFVLLMTNLLVSQGLGTTIFLAIDVLLLVQFLLQLHPSNTSLFSFRVVGKLLLYILPVWVILFTVFPRFTVGFWRREVAVSQNSFSDEMNPGVISQLALSDELAFRVQFSKVTPAPSTLYFRGGILASTEGLHWMKSPRRLELEDWVHEDIEKSPTIPYDVFLEPMFQKWLFMLDYFDARDIPEVRGNRAIIVNGGIAEAPATIQARVNYSGQALSIAPSQERLTQLERQTFLQTPLKLESEVAELAKNLQGKTTGDSIANLFGWFRSEKFLYSLSPGATPTMSAFLFKSKVGFCEHYAAAGALLLRLMGVPARVVVGFQGAERNDLADYWIVKMKNAHAWIEAWIQDADAKRGHWTRLDLTSVVAPMRLTMGAEFFSIASQVPSGVNISNIDELQDVNPFGRFGTKAAQAIDAAEMQWIRFLLAYDFEFQQNLISRFGVQHATRLAFFLILAGALGALFLILSVLSRRRDRKRDPVLKEWHKFCAKLAKKGLVRAVNEGPVDFLARVSVSQPTRAKQISELRDLFLSLRYREQGRGQQLSELLRRFRSAVRRY
ncbi:MAG: DUF3488 domain-containing protein [Bdellovibrionales bacterium]|nr:DUF3488 domain-containing protein [Bdellovibrionales bacterium]